jgi:hypothetical protein
VVAISKACKFVRSWVITLSTSPSPHKVLVILPRPYSNLRPPRSPVLSIDLYCLLGGGFEYTRSSQRAAPNSFLLPAPLQSPRSYPQRRVLRPGVD